MTKRININGLFGCFDYVISKHYYHRKIATILGDN